MSSRALTPEHVELFSTTIVDFFSTLSGEPASVRSAYLLDDADDPVLWDEFHGLITISGAYVGSVCFSAPRKMLTHVLLLSGEGEYSDEKHLDIVGEIANQFSGSSRRKFGESLLISTPVAFAGRSQQIHRRAKSAPYAIPFTWRSYKAGLVVNLEAVPLA